MRVRDDDPARGCVGELRQEKGEYTHTSLLAGLPRVLTLESPKKVHLDDGCDVFPLGEMEVDGNTKQLSEVNHWSGLLPMETWGSGTVRVYVCRGRLLVTQPALHPVPIG